MMINVSLKNVIYLQSNFSAGFSSDAEFAESYQQLLG